MRPCKTNPLPSCDESRGGRAMNAVYVGDRTRRGIDAVTDQGRPLARTARRTKSAVNCKGGRLHVVEIIKVIAAEPIWEGWEGLPSYPSMDTNNLSYRRSPHRPSQPSQWTGRGPPAMITVFTCGRFTRHYLAGNRRAVRPRRGRLQCRAAIQRRADVPLML